MLYQNSNIWANCVKASRVEGSTNTMYTHEVQIPRFILAELNTHGMLKKNTQSSRAVPAKAMLDLYFEKFFVPVAFGKNQSGMSSKEYLTGKEDEEAAQIWIDAENYMREAVMKLSNKDGLNVHKQWSTRLYETFMYTKLVISGTEWDNFFWLRDDLDSAQPEMVDFARKLKASQEEAEVEIIQPGMWHMPYVESEIIDIFGKPEQCFYDANGSVLTEEEALMISASCCAQMSYRKADESIEKAKIVHDRLFNGGGPQHFSPTEHQARAMKHEKANFFERLFPSQLEKGVSHMDTDCNLWSANLKGFVQYRKLLELKNK